MRLLKLLPEAFLALGLFCLLQAAIIAFGSGCTSEGPARRALEDNGFTNIHLTGYSWSCGRDDGTCTGFVATGPTGRRVTGSVGCGLVLKGCTIRLGN